MTLRDENWLPTIIDAYTGGETIESIGTRIGPSRSTVSRALVKAGVPIRKTGQLLAQTVTVPDDTAVLGYIAGLFDGEGNVYWRSRRRRSFRVRIAIYSTTPAVMDWLAARLGGHIRWDHKRTERHGWKPIGIWEINRARDVFAILTALMPYLIIKRDAAVEVVTALKPFL